MRCGCLEICQTSSLDEKECLQYSVTCRAFTNQYIKSISESQLRVSKKKSSCEFFNSVVESQMEK